MGLNNRVIFCSEPGVVGKIDVSVTYTPYDMAS